jgi:hypothetical protein
VSTTLTERRAATRWLLAAIAALGLAWLTTAHPLPIYDGISAPDEPYRYVAPPPGYAATPAATRATASSPAIGGLNVNDLRANSGETGPQVQVVIPKLVVSAGKSATSVSVVVEPVAPTTQPDFGSIDGNVYRLTLTAGSASATFRAGEAPGAIRMRATSDSQPGPLFVHREAAADPWATLATKRVGNDIYEADLRGVGDYALAFKTKDAPSGSTSGSGSGVSPAVFAVIGLLVVSVVAGAVLAARRRGQAP